jgi:hypothetical protein
MTNESSGAISFASWERRLRLWGLGACTKQPIEKIVLR